jgi:hypothetical protein
MNNVKLFEEWESQWSRFDNKSYHWKSDYENSKKYKESNSKEENYEKENWKIIIVTEESMARFMKKHKREPISKKSAGYHINCSSKKDAERLKKRIEGKGSYEGQKIIAIYVQEDDQNMEYF